ncbi:Protein CREG1 [Anthophora retusa]
MILRFAIFGALLALAIEARKYSQFSEDEQWQEFEEYLKWKKAKEISENGPREIKYEKQHDENYDPHKMYRKDQQVPVSNPPPIDEAALMARYIVNQADWVSVATIRNGSGIPYLYLTPLDFTAQDLAKDNRASLLMTLAQGNYCKNKRWDPMDPRCARILMAGKIKPLKNESMELEYAKKMFLERHPGLANMPESHHFYFAKLKIISIVVLDTFGGPKYVSVKDYLHPPTDNVTDEFNRLFPIESFESKSREAFGTISKAFNPVVKSV